MKMVMVARPKAAKIRPRKIVNSALAARVY